MEMRFVRLKSICKIMIVYFHMPELYESGLNNEVRIRHSYGQSEYKMPNNSQGILPSIGAASGLNNHSWG